MPKFKVTVSRTTHRQRTIVVLADDVEGAKKEALDEAGDWDFNDGSGDGEPEYRVESIKEVVSAPSGGWTRTACVLDVTYPSAIRCRHLDQVLHDIIAVVEAHNSRLPSHCPKASVCTRPSAASTCELVVWVVNPTNDPELVDALAPLWQELEAYRGRQST
jgi:hypothetical protein